MTWLQTPEGVERGVCVSVCKHVWCLHVRLTRLATPSSTGSIRSLTEKNLHREGPRLSPPHPPPKSINPLTSRQWDQGGPDLVEAPSPGRLSPQWCSPWLGRTLWQPHCACTTHTRCRCLAAGEERGGERKGRGGEGRGRERRGGLHLHISISHCHMLPVGVVVVTLLLGRSGNKTIQWFHTV